MAFKFPSQEWGDEFKNAVNNSNSYASAAKSWEGDFYFIVDDASKEGFYIDLWHGECRDCIYTTDFDERAPEFAISGKRDKWQKVVEGKLDSVQALMTRQLKLDGSMIKIMKNAKAAQELVKCATQVESEF